MGLESLGKVCYTIPMNLTQEQRQARFHKEAGAQGASSMFFAVVAGFALMALAGFGFGLFVFGICGMIDSFRESHRANQDHPEVKTRLAGGRAPYPWQGNTPSQGEYDEFWEDSNLLRFGRLFCGVWTCLWLPVVVLLTFVV